MKLFWKIGLPVVCCCAAGAVAYIALRPELPTEASLPDVSVLGVCSEDFTYSGIYYQEVGIGYEWIDDDSEKPRYQWFKYESEDGAYLVIDEQNRLRRFVNAYDVRNAETSPDDALSTDALIEKTAAITSKLVMNSNAFSVNDEMTTIDTTKANLYSRVPFRIMSMMLRQLNLPRMERYKNCNLNTAMYQPILPRQRWTLFWKITLKKQFCQDTTAILLSMK